MQKKLKRRQNKGAYIFDFKLLVISLKSYNTHSFLHYDVVKYTFIYSKRLIVENFSQKLHSKRNENKKPPNYTLSIRKMV